MWGSGGWTVTGVNCVSSHSNPFHDISLQLSAGVPVSRVWSSLDSPEARLVASRVESGLTVVDAIAELGDGDNWAIVRDVWLFSARAGAPLSQVMERLASALTESSAAVAARDTAALGSRATRRILCVLPVAGAIVAGISGLDVIGFYVGSPVGAATLGSGALLLGLGWWRMRAISDSVTLPTITAGMLADIAAVSLHTGVVTSTLVGPLRQLALRWGAVGELTVVRELIDRSHATGAPLAPSLVAEARRVRQHDRERVDRQVEALPTRMLIPTGIFLLPSFIVLTVIPTVFVMARSALG